MGSAKKREGSSPYSSREIRELLKESGCRSDSLNCFREEADTETFNGHLLHFVLGEKMTREQARAAALADMQSKLDARAEARYLARWSHAEARSSTLKSRGAEA